MKNDPTRRALKAVANISLTIGLGGCIQNAPQFEVDALAAPDVAFMVDSGLFEVDLGAAVADPDAAVADPDAAAGDAAWEEPDALAADAAPDAAEEADVMAADVGGDATMCVRGTPEWQACCEALGWDFHRDPACAAWGPPVPPAMEVA